MFGVLFRTQTSMAPNVIKEILTWSEERPAWQRDALRRLFTTDTISSHDVAELVEICKGEHGLVQKPKLRPLAAEHLPIASAAEGDVALLSITHLEGVNALAPNQTIAFGSGLTVVFGENAAGKSGYTRVLKRACRARATEDVLGNVLTGAVPPIPHARIAATVNGTKTDIEWTPTTVPSELLASICVFDAHCVPVYLEEKNDVAFRPFGLDTFDKLASLCSEVRTALEKERRLLATTIFVPAPAPVGTAVFHLLGSLTALTPVDDVRKLASMSDSELARMKELEAQKLDFQASDPTALRKDLTLRAARFTAFSTQIRAIERLLGEDRRKAIQDALDAQSQAKNEVQLLQGAALASGLPGTGGAEWRQLWDAAGRFSTLAYPNLAFPPTQDSLCLLCQQPIGSDAAERLKHFAEYASSAAQKDLRKAESALVDAAAPLKAFLTGTQEVSAMMAELQAEDAKLHETVATLVAGASGACKKILAAIDSGDVLPELGTDTNAAAAIEAIAERFRDRASKLKDKAAAFDAVLQKELDELSARQVLKANLAVVEAEIERKKRLSAYDACLGDTSTTAITKKSTELTKQLVTDALRASFKQELSQMGFTHTSVEVRDAGGSKGVLRHQIVFEHAPGVQVGKVLSEGESRSLSLAAFLTELSIAPTKSTIIFDDPVSSLDHVWREKIAKRLAAEAAVRQVIVFTHDLLFWHRLRAEADLHGTPLSLQYVRREGLAGVCLPDVPWFAMSTKERVGYLKNSAQKLAATAKSGTPDDYERDAREIFGLMREAWEIALGDVLLNGVVERYRPSIETQRAKKLHDITAHDLEVLEAEMTEASRWIRGHAAAAADGTPLPSADEVRQRVETFESWVKAINTRRK
ncbi:MAG: AAA family ATPase [Thermoanaerobaculia bacterium]